MHASIRLYQRATARSRIRLVALNDVHNLTNLPKLQTFLSDLDTPPHAVILAGNFLKSSPLSSLDEGRAICSAMVASGITHVCFGHAEGHGVDLGVLRDRLGEISKHITLVNTNLRSHHLKQENEYTRIHTLQQQWSEILELTPAYATLSSHRSGDSGSCVNVALMGLLSDENIMFRDNLFRGVVPIDNCLEAYERKYKKLLVQSSSSQIQEEPDDAEKNALLQRILQKKHKELGLKSDYTSKKKSKQPAPSHNKIDYILPITHQSTQRDRELARHMLKTDQLGIYDSGGIIIGGHHNEQDNSDNIVEEVCCDNVANYPNRKIQIIKTPSHAKQAAWIDLDFNEEDHRLKKATTQIIELESSFQDSFVIQSILDKQLQVLQSLEDQVIVDCSNDDQLALTSKSSTREPTTVGALVCNAMKEELQAHAAILNGGALHGDADYPNNTMTYAQLKQELANDSVENAVVVPMTRLNLYSAITYSRMNATKEPNGFLQTDSGLSLAYPSGCHDEIIHVAMPHNLLVEGNNSSHYCKVLPLLQLGNTLQSENRLPARQHGTPLLDLVTRSCCKNRWVHLFQNTNTPPTFAGYDLNSDGVLDKEEITLLLTKVLGYEPHSNVVDDMIQSIDLDGNGVIDEDEFNVLLARVERHKNQTQT